ncbi:MAG: Fe-S cluster assembly protein SufD [Cytophagales bacterium]|nr:Fe-S cluster assembly protein SufD [Cytophagales bacterium]
MSYKDTLVADFENQATTLTELRKEAFASFQNLDFPTIRDEEYKFTNVRKIAQTAYKTKAGNTLTAEQVQSAFIPNLEGNVLVFVNGVYSAEYSTIVTDTNKLKIQTLGEAISENSETFNAHYAKILATDTDAFNALNTAYAEEGLYVHVPKGKIVEEPITLYFLADAQAGDVATHPRNLIVVEENAQVRVSEVYKTFGENRSFTNEGSEIYVAESAIVDFYRIQNDGDNASQAGTTQVLQAQKSVFSATTITLSGEIIRNNLNITLGGEHIESHMNGLYLVDGKTHIDNHTVADHQFPNCESHELYKGIMDDFSRGVFNGKIFVRQDAQKTNAFQSNKNILLSDSATVNTKPQLEIWADDVSCSHGCTTGQLDEKALFYLQQRGISKKQAQALLTKAFAGEVVERIKIDSLRKYVEGLIENRLS